MQLEPIGVMGTEPEGPFLLFVNPLDIPLS